jgi:dUTP pyrophosphatase
MTAVLSKIEIKQFLEQKPPLVEGYLNLSQQLQPNGFDLTLRDIAMFQNWGQIGGDNIERRLPDLAPLMFGMDRFIDVIPGSYLITYNEVVHLPNTIMALGKPRSSVLRCGVNIGTAVWDAGYNGRSQSLMVVYNTQGFRVQKNARMMQLVFFRLSSETDGYSGTYQNENIER